LVEIKDKDYNWLPGIEGGDIGPKLGFHAKENGYMYLRSVRIPKNNLFTKYVEVTDNGEYKKVGDPRVGYGTMMFIRELLSCMVPKVYAQSIIIGARYSLFRKQGVNAAKQENTIIDYQTQQDKVIPRIAEYYAMTIAGTKIAQVSEDNKEKVLQSDFSLLQETHSNLAFSKALFSELSHDGI
jgi:acyl-CoA oxidase